MSTRDLHSELGGGIPLHEAAGFFIKVKTGSAPSRELPLEEAYPEVATRFKLAAAKLGFAAETVPPESDGDIDAGVPEAADAPGAQNKPGPAQAVDNYIAQEQKALEAAEQAAAEFYQQKAQAAQAQLQQAQDQIGQLSQQVQEQQTQIDQSQAQIQGAMQQAQIAQQAALQNVQQAHDAAHQSTATALKSMEEVLRQKQLAAAIRMGTLQLKDQVMGAMANDPTEALAQQLTSPPPSAMAAATQPQIDPATGQPMAPAPGAEAGGPPAGGEGGGESTPKSESSGGEKKEKSESKPEKKGPDGGDSTKITVNTGSDKKASAAIAEAAKRLPYALAGMAGGAALGHAASKTDVGSLKGKIKHLEAQEGPRSFGQSFNLAQARLRLLVGETAADHPTAAKVVGGALGALSGATAGPAAVNDVKKGFEYAGRTSKLDDIGKNLG